MQGRSDGLPERIRQDAQQSTRQTAFLTACGWIAIAHAVNPGDYAPDSVTPQGIFTMFMSVRRTLLVACAAAILPSAAFAKPECTQLFYSVNDYGKEGPTRDAQALLDKYIEKWAQEKGIKKYKTGKKDVSCELFLDAIVFNEYTCKATANVCWTPTKRMAKRTAKSTVTR
jgi:hypothetical protein